MENNSSTPSVREFSYHEIQFAKVRIDAAEKAIGPLTPGQKIDLVLDNCPWICNSVEARHLVSLVPAHK